MNRYSMSELLKTGYAFIITKIFFNKARLIRRPVYIRGKKSIAGGKKLTTGYACRFDLSGIEKTLFIGDNCEFGDMTHIVAYKKVEIGNNVLIASKCFISDTNHGCYNWDVQSSPYTSPKTRELNSDVTRIGDNVWIGENVVILAGTLIGDGCIIGANSVLKGKYGKNEIIVGAPAKAVKKWDEISNKWIKYS